MIFLKLGVVLLCGVLFSWGGFNLKQMRRFVMPVLLTIPCCLIAQSFWPLTMLTAMIAFSLGYGDNSFFRHIFGPGWGRSVWGLLGAICLSLALFLTHHLPVAFFVIYLALNFTLENLLKNVNQLLGDLIIGMGFGLIILLIH